MPRRTIPTLSLLGTLIMLPACGSPDARRETQPTHKTTGPRLEQTMEVVRLQYIGAAETAEIVNDLISTAGGDESPTRVIADERLNALIVYGDQVSRKHIHDLLVALDRAPPR